VFRGLGARAANEETVTIVELVVVIAIIGVLSAMAALRVLGAAAQAPDTTAESEARTAQIAMETYLTDSASGDYGSANVTTLRTIEPSLRAVEALSVAGPFGSGVPLAGYDVSVASKATRTWFHVTRGAHGQVTRYCDQPGTGACRSGTPKGAPAGSGNW